MEGVFLSKNIFIIWETNFVNMNSMEKKLTSIETDNQKKQTNF